MKRFLSIFFGIFSSAVIVADEPSKAEDLLSTPGTSANLWLALAGSYASDKQPLSAELAARNALLWEPDSLPAKKLLLAALLAQDKLQEAALLARPLIAESPQDPQLWLVLIKQKLDSGKNNEALELCEVALHGLIQDPQLCQLFIVLLMQKNMLLPALDVADRLAAEKKLPPTIAINLAKQLFHLHFNKEAAHVLTAIADTTLTSSQQWECEKISVKLKAAAATPEERLRLWQDALKRNSTDLDVLCETARAFLAANHHHEAELLLLSAIAAAPQAYEPRIILANHYIATKNYPEAKKLLREAYAIQPSQAIADCINRL